MTQPPSAPATRNVLVSVGGSVAAYKACDVVTELRRRGCEVRVAMTGPAARFVSPALLRSLSGHRVSGGLWNGGDSGHGMPHLDLGAWSRAHAIVAASADLIARLAVGLADDVVSATALASRAPLLVAPAMETVMWEHPATRANVAILSSRGVRLVGPVSGRLATGHEGLGRMAEPDEIVAAIEAALA